MVTCAEGIVVEGTTQDNEVNPPQEAPLNICNPPPLNKELEICSVKTYNCPLAGTTALNHTSLYAEGSQVGAVAASVALTLVLVIYSQASFTGNKTAPLHSSFIIGLVTQVVNVVTVGFVVLLL